MRSIAKTEAEKLFLELIETVLGPLGYRAVDVDVHVGPTSIVRLFVEWQDPSKRIGLQDCAEASRLLDPVMENVEWLPGAYNLEVSSPGLDRRLRLKADFEKAVGKDIRLKLEKSKEGFGAKPWGTLSRVDDDLLVFVQNKKEFSVGFGDVRQAHVMWKGESVRP